MTDSKNDAEAKTVVVHSKRSIDLQSAKLKIYSHDSTAFMMLTMMVCKPELVDEKFVNGFN